MTFSCLVYKRTIATLYFLFDYPAPAHPMIGQLTVPFVVIKSDLSLFQTLLWHFALAPGFAAIQFVKLAFGVGVPGIEQLAGISALRFAAGIPLGHHLLCGFALFLVIKLFGNLD